MTISKAVLPALPQGYEKTKLGDARRAIRQYRGPGGTHVREYPRKFVVHVDRVDPRKDPVGHLVLDSPGTLLSVAAGLALVKGPKGISTQQGRGGRPSGGRGSSWPHDALAFFFLFGTFNTFAKFLKRFIFGRSVE